MPVPNVSRGVLARLRRPLMAVTALGAAVVGIAVLPSASFADACTPPVVSKVACENTQPGTPESAWEVDGSGDSTIQGYATQMSTNLGGTVSFKISSATANYHIDIYRLGWYGGNGARLMQGNIAPSRTGAQPSCLTQAATGLVDCGNWFVSASWTIPSTAVSGLYEAHLVRNDTGGDSAILFVVRDDGSHSPIVLQTSDATWQAYNSYGGESLYSCTTLCPPGNPRAYQAAFKVSYNRPFHTADDDSGRSWPFSGAEYSMIRFLERNGYDMSYVSSVDVASNPSLLLNHKLFISSGHDEYWSASQRANLQAARDAGVNLAFFTGNEGFWKTRWEPSIDGTNAANRTLVAYKDTHFDAPTDPVEWTGTWRDPRFTSPSVNTPENALTGQSFVVNSGTTAIQVPAPLGKLRMWRNTAAASQSTGALTLAPNTLGYEWDVDPDNGFRPAGEIHLSSTTATGLELFTDFGSSAQPGGAATHTMSLYKAASGALVFGSGTVQWAWGLDSDNSNGTENKTMQQATVNLLADMGAQPTTLLTGLVGASATTDTTRPTSAITSAPSSVADGSRVTISGTAADSGGVVAGVEVSTDGGTSWHQATVAPGSSTTWSYSWIAHGNPAVTIKSRAADDSGNIETPGAGVPVSVGCPCSIWGSTFTPSPIDTSDPTPVEVGVKFKSDTFGTITGVRFYKASTNTGVHTGSLWTASGTRLAQATFTGETASGWQTVTFADPVQLTPNTTYVASYYAPNGHYAATSDYFWRAPAPGPNGGGVIDSAPLHGIVDSGTTLNGIYSYSATSTFPTNSFGAGNYWVDVMFTPTPAPGPVSNVSATAAGRTSATVTWTAPSTGGTPTGYKITPYVGSTAQAATTINGAPPDTSATVTGLTNGTAYTFTVQAVNPSGSGPESAKSNAVTPLNPVAPSAPKSASAIPASNEVQVSWSAPDSDGDSPITGYTVTPFIGSTAQTPVSVGASTTTKVITGLTDGTAYTFKVTAANSVGSSPASAPTGAVTPEGTILDFATPATVDSQDGNPVELGVKFTADNGGSITGIRFYKSAANTGTHIGSLWTATGTRLAQATFTGESASGWQTVTFASPVSVTAGTTYVASYFAPSGRYSVTGGGLSSAVDNPPLHALASGTSANGLYAYSATSTFPTNTYNAADYFVDVLYAVAPPGQATGVTAAAGGNAAADVSWTAPASGGPPSAYKITPYIGSVAQTATTISGSPPATTARITGLTTGTTYTFTVQAINASGPGAESAASNSVTPSGPVPPSAPTAVVARPASNSASVSWTTPTSSGDSPITSYTVTPFLGSTAQTPVVVAAPANSKTITGLTDGAGYTFKVSATNAIGTGPASAASNTAIPEDTILDFATPSTTDSGDTVGVEVGVKFKTDFDGSVTGIRFYKAATNTGTHVGSLWTAAGTRLAQATFTNESATGWQTVTFASPVAITAGTTYVASYLAPNGHYSVTGGAFASGADNAPLHALADATSANGVYAYTSTGAFPTNSFNASDYMVDVLFQPAAAPGQPTGVSATAGSGSANVSWTAPTTGGPVTSYTITPYVGSTAQSATTITGSPPATSKTISGLTPGTTYTFTVQASNPGGSGPASAQSNAVTPAGAAAPGAPTGVKADPDTKSATVSWTPPADDGGSAITGYTVTPFIGAAAQTPVSAGASATSVRVTGLTNDTGYTFTVKATNAAGTGSASAASSAVLPLDSLLDFGTPGVIDSGDTTAVNVGVKFQADSNGVVKGIRFYKASNNTGTHIGDLWSAAGQQLGQATFTGESASGWQKVTFATPVPVTAGTTYIASYLAPNGHYSVTGAAFSANGLDNGPLHALANSTSPNGVYAYGSTPAAPTNTFNSANYWVDVVYNTGTGQ